MTETIWIVEGTTGEYSDRLEWRVCAFRDEVKAKELAVELKRLAMANFVANGKYSGDWGKSEIGKEWLAKDPDSSQDYTGTDYTAYSVKLR